MARNTTAMKRGWNYDIPNSALKAMVDGKEAFALKAATAGTYGSYALYQMGTGKPTTAYEALAYMVDGYNVNLATGYASAFTRKYALDIEADTGSTDLTGNVNVGAIQGRVVAGTTQTNCGISGVVGILDVGTVNLQGNHNGMCGVLDFYGNCTLGTGATCYGAAVVGVVWNEAQTTLGAGAVLSGIDLVENGAVYAYGTGALNPAVNIRGNWQYGIYIKTSGLTTGVNIEGTVVLALGIGSTTALTTATSAKNAILVQSNYSKADGYHIANFFSSAYTGTGAAVGSLRAVVGQVDLSGIQTTANTAQYLVGVHGRAKVSGTAHNTQLFVTGVMGQILAGAGTWTAADHVSALWGDWQLASAVAAGSTELLYLSNNANSTTGNPTNVMFVYAPRVTNFIDFRDVYTTAGEMCALSTSAGAMTHTVKCLVNGTAAYLHLYNA